MTADTSIQLYTLRDEAAVDFRAVLMRLGAIGYVGAGTLEFLLAPDGALTGKAVSAIVARAAGRCGVHASAHRLRHTAASDLLRAGASLPEVGQVLRQTSILNTARYAKIDHAKLAAVAQPWPGGGR